MNKIKKIMFIGVLAFLFMMTMFAIPKNNIIDVNAENINVKFEIIESNCLSQSVVDKYCAKNASMTFENGTYNLNLQVPKIVKVQSLKVTTGGKNLFGSFNKAKSTDSTSVYTFSSKSISKPWNVKLVINNMDIIFKLKIIVQN